MITICLLATIAMVAAACASKEDDNPITPKEDDGVFDGKTVDPGALPSSIEAACAGFPDGPGRDADVATCIEYGSVLPSHMSVAFELVSGGPTRGYAYLLDDIRPLPEKFQTPLKGTFFTATMKPRPTCELNFPRGTCTKEETSAQASVDGCIESLNSQMEEVRSQHRGEGTLASPTYDDFCLQREDYSICGSHPPEDLAELNQAYGNICSHSPTLDIIGFATFLMKDSIHPTQDIRILAISPHRDSCDFQEEWTRAQANSASSDIPCAAGKYGAWLFIIGSDVTWLPRNEYPFVMNMSQLRSATTIGEMLDVSTVVEKGAALLTYSGILNLQTHPWGNVRDFRNWKSQSGSQLICRGQECGGESFAPVWDRLGGSSQIELRLHLADDVAEPSSGNGN